VKHLADFNIFGTQRHSHTCASVHQAVQIGKGFTAGKVTAVICRSLSLLPYTRVIPKVSGLDILDNNIYYNLYISETYILYELYRVGCGYDVVVIFNYDVTEH